MEPQNQGWKLSHGQGQRPRKVGDVWSTIGCSQREPSTQPNSPSVCGRGLRSTLPGAGETGTLSSYKRASELQS